MKRFCMLAVLLLFCVAVLPVFADDEMPVPARNAVAKSQGLVVASVRSVSGGEAVYFGFGSLVSEDGLVVTNLSVLPKETDVLNSFGNVTFNGAPALLVTWSVEADLALLKVKHIPKKMRSVAFTEDITVGSEVFARVSGDLPLGESVVRYRNVTVRSTVVNKAPLLQPTPAGLLPSVVEFLLLDKPYPYMFEGALFVNKNGEGMGMGRASRESFPAIVSAASIRKFVQQSKKASVERKKQGGYDFEEQYDLMEQQGVLQQILAFYTTEALERPANIVACVQEMFAIRYSGECRDRFSHYEPPRDTELMAEQQSGVFGGVGMELTVRDGRIVVVAPMPGGPAERAGVKSGDMIVEVDGKPVKTLQHAVLSIRGEKGKTVMLTIAREGADKPLYIIIVREEIIVRAVYTETVHHNGKPIGIIRVTTFSEQTAQFLPAVQSLQAKGVTEFVIDLRNNPGGLFAEALRFVAHFMGEGDVVITIRNRTGDKKYDRARIRKEFGIKEFGALRGVKMVVLINEGSASASEIVSGVLQDYGFPVVGTKSFGKGVGQTVFPLFDGSTLALTTFEFLVGNKQVVVRDRGVSPDVPIEKGADGKDLQLEKALALLTE